MTMPATHYWAAFERAVRRYHRPRWRWHPGRRKCACGENAPCPVLAELLVDMRLRTASGITSWL